MSNERNSIFARSGRPNAVVAQSGGPTAAINATLAGVISACRDGGAFGTLYGARYGLSGMIDDNLIDLFSAVPESEISLLSLTPAAALGSCRIKLGAPDDTDGRYEKIFATLAAHGVTTLFYIGGNDSMDTAHKLHLYSQTHNLGVRVIGVPKTIDNDMCGTDHTPGYGSAAKFVAVTMSEIMRDCAVYNTPAVTIVEIMGRDAGWLAAAAGLACPTPDLIYLPERPLTLDRFIADAEECLTRKPNIVVAVSEGVRSSGGAYVGADNHSGAKDSFGHTYLAGAARAMEAKIKSELKIKTRSFELSLPQRCAAHIASKTDIDEAFEIGRRAVAYAADGMSGVFPAVERKHSPLRFEIFPNKLSEAANGIRQVPDRYINEAANGVTAEFIEDFRQLIMGETEIKYKNGVPAQFEFIK